MLSEKEQNLLNDLADPQIINADSDFWVELFEQIGNQTRDREFWQAFENVLVERGLLELFYGCTAERTIKDVSNQLICRYDAKGNRKIVPCVRNVEIVLEQDLRFSEKICFNEFSNQLYLRGYTPWESKLNFRPWSSRDDSEAFSIIQADYGLSNRNDYYDAIKNVSHRQSFHPVKDYLESLQWDGKEHIRHLLPDYLGAEDTGYHAAVMRLTMVGAVARIYQPGCKNDNVPILVGAQGCGKSTMVQLLALDDTWFCDSLDSLDSDRSVQALSGSWIVELAELKSLTRTSGGVDSVKRFLSARQDKIRLPYERRAEIFPRQSIFIGTTNREDFLTDETGNRRFLIVHVGEHEPTKDLFNPAVMDDIKEAWAEAVAIYKSGDYSLVLPKEYQEEAQALQDNAMADDGKRGIIEKYLEGRERVCVLEVWQDALDEQGRPQKWQSSEITSIILSLPGWYRMKSPGRFGQYGMQRGFYYQAMPAKFVDISGEFVDTSGEFVDVQDDDCPFE